jgi:diguanylate cyclase (GGDEF)-like protein/PAS domain S-box-containing protein
MIMQQNGFLPEPAPLPRAPENLRLLLVDDDKRLQMLVLKLVQGNGREVFQCGTVAEAIEILEEKRIDLALVNIRLPKRSGMDLMNWIRERGLDLSVIVVSGDDSIEAALTALRCGAFEYVRKPFDPALLRRTVDDALAARQLTYENRLATSRLERSERLHRYLVDRSPDLIFALDSQGRFWFVNDRFTSLLGFEKDELIGTHYTVIVHHDDLRAARWACSERRTGPRATSNVEIRLRRRTPEGAETGSLASVTVAVSAVGLYAPSSDQGASPQRFLGTYGVARDITNRKQAEQITGFHATHDALTGCPNRSLFLDRMRQAIARARRNFLDKGHLAVLFIDLDRFKEVNDTYGHVKGDQLLQQVAARLRRCLRGSDTLSRIGGDEFVALIAELGGREGAEAVATKILNALREPFLLGDGEFRTTVSIGAAIYPDDGASELELMRNADLAMYHVKRKGRDGIGYFTPDMNTVWADKLELENELRAAIEHGALELHYQPIHNIATGHVEALEALVRWRHPVHGLMDPARFVHIAEESGLICSLGERVLDAACADLRTWQLQGFPDLRMAVNLSAREFDRPDLVDCVVDTLKRHAVPAKSLELEITESALAEDLDAVADRAGRLRRSGVRIAIDDFGTRYSSLAYLQSLPISGIKIDQSFVRELGVRSSSASVVSAMIGIARGFGLSLVAEGVEKSEQVDSLRTFGCDVMQGYHFSRPLPAGQVGAYLLRFNPGDPGHSVGPAGGGAPDAV